MKDKRVEGKREHIHIGHGQLIQFDWKSENALNTSSKMPCEKGLGISIISEKAEKKILPSGPRKCNR